MSPTAPNNTTKASRSDQRQDPPLLLAHDIAQDARHTRLAKTLESYGNRIPHSVFIIDAKPAKMVRPPASVTDKTNLATDSPLIADPGPLSADGKNRIEFVGVTRPFTSPGPPIL